MQLWEPKTGSFYVIKLQPLYTDDGFVPCQQRFCSVSRCSQHAVTHSSESIFINGDLIVVLGAQHALEMQIGALGQVLKALSILA